MFEKTMQKMTKQQIRDRIAEINTELGKEFKISYCERIYSKKLLKTFNGNFNEIISADGEKISKENNWKAETPLEFTTLSSFFYVTKEDNDLQITIRFYENNKFNKLYKEKLSLLDRL